MPLLNQSVHLGNYSIFSILMAKDVSLLMKDASHNNILHEAAAQQNGLFLRDLLKWKETANIIDGCADDGRTPIARAVEAGYLGNVTQLIKAGADLTLAYDGDKDLIQLAQEAAYQVPNGTRNGDEWEQIIEALEMALGHQ